MKTVTVRIEDQLKAQAEDVLALHGVSPTEAVNHLYLYVAQHGRLPFRVRPVSESPEDVYSDILQQVRGVNTLIDSVSGLPAGAPERPGVIRHCLHRCRQLQQDIERNIGFMAGVRCRDPLPRTGDEDSGDYWRWMVRQLKLAVSALESSAPDLAATLNGVAGQITGLYWQLATWIDLYALQESDASRKPENPDRRDSSE